MLGRIELDPLDEREVANILERIKKSLSDFDYYLDSIKIASNQEKGDNQEALKDLEILKKFLLGRTS